MHSPHGSRSSAQMMPAPEPRQNPAIRARSNIRWFDRLAVGGRIMDFCPGMILSERRCPPRIRCRGRLFSGSSPRGRTNYRSRRCPTNHDLLFSSQLIRERSWAGRDDDAARFKVNPRPSRVHGASDALPAAPHRRRVARDATRVRAFADHFRGPSPGSLRYARSAPPSRFAGRGDQSARAAPHLNHDSPILRTTLTRRSVSPSRKRAKSGPSR
jgi:hypothetical protein